MNFPEQMTGHGVWIFGDDVRAEGEIGATLCIGTRMKSGRESTLNAYCHGRRALTGSHRRAGGATGRLRAFTLIELLVVIGIISLLISIMTPSLARARQQAKGTVCLSTLNELMKGIIAYSSDHEFALPLMKYEVRPNSNVFHGWAELLYADLYQDRDFPENVSFPVMHNFEGRYKLFTCKEGDPLTDNTGHYRVYELAWSRGSLDKVKARIPLIIDANPRVTYAEDLLRADIPRERIAGLQGEAYIDERHYSGANYAFNDGHAERSTQLKEKLAEDWDLDPRTPNE